MALALYRRYRPDTFEGVIGQDQVTVPLMRALDEGKLTHAYLFSGPRGCGKTSSARILARCVNCAKGPTSHPCGECESCRDLATGGPGSIDVVEIDAASHNGVDDARELRERAGFAPARDRYKIFILDEAHMVTPQGFNALLKIVEEPPEHVMFIFATTEPDKVIGTIRSRTHHYPFRLVPAEIMGPYLEKICEEEHIKTEPGVLKLAMRAGGGSVRDTLSVLDQLMVGSVDGVITHDASVALLGFTPEALIGEAVDAVIDKSGERLYGVIQKVVVGGFDPRRFVEDLLARVRDLLVLTLAGERAESVLSDTAEAEEMGDLHRQAAALGLGTLTAMADVINDTLGAMTGAISPRMRLELLAARLMAGAKDGFAASGTAAAGVGAVGAGEAVATSGSAGAGAGVKAVGGFAGASRNAGGAQGSGFAGAERNRHAGTASTSVTGGFAGSGHADRQVGPRDGAAAQVSGTVSNNVDGGTASATGAVSARTGFATSSVGESSGSGVSTTTASGNGTTPVSGAGMSAPTAAASDEAAPQQPDNRTPDQKWDALVAALPEDVRRYVARDKVLRIAFRPYKQTGRMRLWLKFDKPLSKYAFALAVAAEPVDGSTKVVNILRAEVRKVFGEQTEIAPTPTTDDGQKTPAFSKLPAGEQQRIKAQLLQENLKAAAGLAAAGESGGQGGQEGGREPSAAAAHTGGAASADDDESHRAGSHQTGADPWEGGAAAAGSDTHGSGHAGPSDTGAKASPGASTSASVLDDDDPWAHPLPAPASVSGSAGVSATSKTGGDDGSDHPHKHVAVPDLSDGVDPWAQPASAAPNAGNTDHADASGRTRQTPDSANAGADPWNAGADPWNTTPAAPAPGTATAGGDGSAVAAVERTGRSAAADGRPASANRDAASAIDRSGVGDDPWNQGPRQAVARPAAPTPAASPVPDASDDPWKDVPPPEEPDDPWNAPGGQAPAADPWNMGASAQHGPGGTGNMTAAGVGAHAAPVRDPWNVHQAAPPPGPQVSADEDEYSMDDESVGTATAMDRDELRKLFEVKKVEEFSADDPRNPRNIHPAPRHDDE